MGLLSKGLLEALKNAGVCEDAIDFDGAHTLAQWLEEHGIAASHPAIEKYFGLPYHALKRDAYLTVATLSAYETWALYYHVRGQYYVCVRPASVAEKAAFHAQYGDVPLYITDDTTVHATLAQGCLPQTQIGQAGQRAYDVHEMVKQGTAHIDGMIGMLIDDAIKSEATDIHLYNLEGAFHIDFRIHGERQPYVALTNCSAEPLLNKLKLMGEMDIAEHRLPQDGHIAMVLDGETVHLRLGTLPLLGGEKIVIRLLPEQNQHANLEKLGFDALQKKALVELLKTRQGLLLITGPTNSGKTTTLYACLGMLAKEGALVYTIEDPVEAMISGVQQSQVNVRGGYSFAQGLRGMLRSDPDVLAVGEWRDAETVDIAARAALSGHLVVATLHAANAHQAVNRLRDLGLSDLMLSAVLLGVVNQRLVARPCDYCGGRGIDAKGACCRHCMGKGTIGRMGVQELWIPTEAERAQIELGTNSVTLRQHARAAGFRELSIVAREKGVALSDGEERL